MRKSVKNCRDLNMRTIRVRRERPGSLAVSLALAITMLAVYLLTLQAAPEETAEAASSLRSAAEIHMEGMEAEFLASSIHEDALQARVAAAVCADNGGAGCILPEGDGFAVIHSAGGFSDSDGMVIHRSAGGLTLKIDAPISTVTALSDGISVLRALALETGGLADALESGKMDAKTLSALLEVYKTQVETALEGLRVAGPAEIALIRQACEDNLDRIKLSLKETDAGRLRLLHAGAQADWIGLLEGLREMA